MPRTVTVTGRGSASAAPDAAVLRVAAFGRAPSVREAYAAVASAAEALLDAASDAVGSARVASAGVDVYTSHGPQGPDGFECRHAVTVRCPSVDVAGRLLDTLVDEVGDRLQVDGLSLQVSDPADAEARARKAAYADAVTRADALAELASAERGEALTVTEGGAHVAGHVQAARAAMADSMPVAPGEQTVACSVTVTFELL